MGTWGVGLFQDDVTCDIKQEYLNRLRIGYTNEEATEEVIDYNADSVEDEEEAPLFWFALADIQWRYGRLLPEVKRIAMEYLKSGEDLERWKCNEKLYKKRKFVLEELEEKLNSPMPPERKVSKLYLTKAAWRPGDLLLYKIGNGEGDPIPEVYNSRWYGKYVMIRVINDIRLTVGSLPQDKYYNEMSGVKMYNWVGDHEPDLNIMNKLSFMQLRQFSPYTRTENRTFSFSKKELKKLDFKVIEHNPKSVEHIEPIDVIHVPFQNPRWIDKEIIDALEYAKKNNCLFDESTSNNTLT